jgi:Inner membrane protein CreD
MRGLLAIGFIWFGCAVAWLILGSTVMVRTGDSSSALNGEVSALWGPPMQQAPPRASYRVPHKRIDKVIQHDAQGRSFEQEIEREEFVDVTLPLERSDIQARLDLEHRKKGLLWFATYGVQFHAEYAVVNTTTEPRRVEMTFPLATNNAVYDGFAVLGKDGRPVNARVENGAATWSWDMAPGERRDFTVGYASRGTSTWGYEVAAGTGQVRNFKLVVDTNFGDVDFPAGTLSPSRHARAGGGWHGEWNFTSLVSNQPIGLELPQRASPGPLAARITFFAPVGLLFFFFVVAIFARTRAKEMHPLNYFFFGTAFFAFHLLFSYLVDHLPIAPSFALASAASILLVVTYAQLYVGWKFALREMGLAQLIYLVLFSFTFFWQGFTGLAITIGAILTLAVMMQVTGRADRLKRIQAAAKIK